MGYGKHPFAYSYSAYQYGLMHTMHFKNASATEALKTPVYYPTQTTQNES